MLRAFASLAKLYPDLRLSFVGPDKGIQEEGIPLTFDQFVRKNLPTTCQSRIDFHGRLSSQDVQALRAEHFMTVVASRFEIFPYSVLEAMSLGCPIIASSVGGIPELIATKKMGYCLRAKKSRDFFPPAGDYSTTTRSPHRWERKRGKTALRGSTPGRSRWKRYPVIMQLSRPVVPALLD